MEVQKLPGWVSASEELKERIVAAAKVFLTQSLAEVVNHYGPCFSLRLTAQEQGDVVEYLESLPRRK
jgi:hypothetical protein